MSLLMSSSLSLYLSLCRPGHVSSIPQWGVLITPIKCLKEVPWQPSMACLMFKNQNWQYLTRPKLKITRPLQSSILALHSSRKDLYTILYYTILYYTGHSTKAFSQINIFTVSQSHSLCIEASWPTHSCRNNHPSLSSSQSQIPSVAAAKALDLYSPPLSPREVSS